MSNKEKGTVTSINSKKKKETGKTPKPPKLDQGELERNLLEYLTRKSNDIPSKDLPLGIFIRKDQTPLNIGVYLPSESSTEYKIVAYKEGGLAEELSKESLMGLIDQKVAHFGDYPETLTAKYCFSTQQVGALTRRLLRSGKMRIKDWPLPLGFKSSPGVYFNRRGFDPIREATPEDFPFIYSYLKRIKNWEALCQIIGSVIAGKPVRKYTPLLYGKPGGGKSTFYRLLKNLFGDDAVGLVPKTYKDKYSCTFVENTAAWFGDDFETKFLSTALFKELTGSDSFALRKMNKDYQKVPLKGVFFLNINASKLVLPNDPAVVEKRIIPNEVLITDEWLDTAEIKDEARVDALAEADYPAFSGYCLRLFEELNGGAVTYDLGDIRDYCRDENDLDLETLFEMHYEFIPNWDVPGVAEKPKVTIPEFTAKWEEIAYKYPTATRGKTNHHLRAWICEKLGIEGRLDKNTKLDGKTVKCMQGIRVKSPTTSGYHR